MTASFSYILGAQGKKQGKKNNLNLPRTGMINKRIADIIPDNLYATVADKSDPWHGLS